MNMLNHASQIDSFAQGGFQAAEQMDDGALSSRV